jgi:hypothetical protein
MKRLLPFALLIAGSGFMQAAMVHTISLDLSALHPGSTLSGTFTLSDTPIVGDTAPVVLTFSDPANYSPTELDSIITIQEGTPSGFAIEFTALTFTNLNGSPGPINTRDVSLSRTFLARCDSFPCAATGLFQDRSPAVFTAEYTITPATVPEPGYAVLVSVLLTGMVLRKRFI